MLERARQTDRAEKVSDEDEALREVVEDNESSLVFFWFFFPFISSSVPGCQNLRRSDIGHHVEEIVTHEDSSLQQQEGEADAVPDDARLVSRQIADLFSCNVDTKRSRSDGEVRLIARCLWGVISLNTHL